MSRVRAPIWFWIAVVLLILWSIVTVTTTAFPILIALVCVFQVWPAGHAAQRGWIG